MASWRMNGCFAPLNAALKARFSNIVIYGIGDPAHQATRSDHNPNRFGRVNAQDYMIRNGFTPSDAVWLCAWLIQDPRTKYVIYNRRIWTSDTREWRPYTLDNPHTDHVHHSVHDDADNNDRPWKLEKDHEMNPADVWTYNTGTAEEPYQAVGRLKTIFARTGNMQGEITALRNEVKTLTDMVKTLTELMQKQQ